MPGSSWGWKPASSRTSVRPVACSHSPRPGDLPVECGRRLFPESNQRVAHAVTVLEHQPVETGFQLPEERQGDRQGPQEDNRVAQVRLQVLARQEPLRCGQAEEDHGGQGEVSAAGGALLFIA